MCDALTSILPVFRKKLAHNIEILERRKRLYEKKVCRIILNFCNLIFDPDIKIHRL